MTTSAKNFEPDLRCLSSPGNNAELTYLGAVDLIAVAIVFSCPQFTGLRTNAAPNYHRANESGSI